MVLLKVSDHFECVVRVDYSELVARNSLSKSMVSLMVALSLERDVNKLIAFLFIRFGYQGRNQTVRIKRSRKVFAHWSQYMKSD